MNNSNDAKAGIGDAEREMPALFGARRLPSDVFVPLGSPNREAYWGMIVAIYRTYFAAGAPPLPSEGVYHSELTDLLEQRILRVAHWERDADITPEVNAGTKANAALALLARTGWLKRELYGARHTYRMPPIVQRFLDSLIDFAEEGPVLIGGKIQLIYNQVRAVSLDPARNVAAFSETAKHVHGLIILLKGLETRVREVISDVASMQETPDLVRQFFGEYVGRLLVADYHRMFTQEHPLQYRSQILDMIHELNGRPAMRQLLVNGYRHEFGFSSVVEAERRYEKDLFNYLLLEDVSLHLQALQRAVAEGTARAVAIVEYRLRNSRLAAKIARAIEAVRDGEESVEHVPIPLLRGDMLSPHAIAKPRELPVPKVSEKLIDEDWTEEELAYLEAKRRMRDARSISRASVENLLAIQPPGKIFSESIRIETVENLFTYLALSRQASQQDVGGRVGSGKGRGLMPPRIELYADPGQRSENEFFEGPRFVIYRE